MKTGLFLVELKFSYHHMINTTNVTNLYTVNLISFKNGEEGRTVTVHRVTGWDVGVENSIPVKLILKTWEETNKCKSGDITLVVCK
jgi:hypothetical protein